MEEKYQKYFNFFNSSDANFEKGLEKLSSAGLQNITLDTEILLNKNQTEDSKGKLALSFLQKNVWDRFKKYNETVETILKTRPKILNGNTFEEKVDSYEMLVEHVKSTWIKSKKLYLEGDYALSVFLSILTIEETAKMNFAWLDLNQQKINNDIKLAKFFTNHKNKLFIGIMSACLINSRLDRILGIEFIIEMIELSEEKNGFMNLRNSSLYIDYKNGKTLIPNKAIDEELSKKLCVLSGEIMAETAGFFVWDWKDLLKEVNDFEIEVGLHSEIL
jgi:AbiV family abortive infection protein